MNLIRTLDQGWILGFVHLLKITISKHRTTIMLLGRS
jgi:hypothetical protein